MNLKFLAKGAAPQSYAVAGEVVNGLDLSVFPEGATYTGSDVTLTAGIYNVERINGELFVTLGQCCVAYECSTVNGSHDWAESEWINSADYDPSNCYIVATSAPPAAEYVKRENGWTVKMPDLEEESAA
ncbi:hypothetical protein J7J47_11865 [Halomonas sp. ISL-60]|uniref:hypothetical protein n=1 Tax=Halomonas sp. ISL-56 TaxID=2819149 RepID=UPI001BEC71AD|nr:hypothetical protein [Halomonas sp. ISL-56]MBT2772919.1 hypothetical protein [Halomonas sp. ISL-60]MBT2799966.1 hypothetical protein [Halomonas sp. ISL-56]